MPDKVLADLKKRMEGALNSFHNDMKGIRTGRANPSLLENITVDVYGSRMPLNQVATISAPEARLLSVQVWDNSNVASVVKAINNANLGLNPSSDGTLVRVPMPDLSEERRKEMCKIASQYAEKAKVAIRNVRRDGMESLKKLEKDGDVSQDELHSRGDEVQKITDQYTKDIDEALKVKENDVMTS